MPTPMFALRFLLGAPSATVEPDTSTALLSGLAEMAEALEKDSPLSEHHRHVLASYARRLATVALDYSAGGITEEPSTGSARAPIPSHVVSALAELESVWNNPGQHVDYHEYQQRRLHERWASLERIILRLLKLRDGSVVGAAQVAKASTFVQDNGRAPGVPTLSEERKQFIESHPITGEAWFWLNEESLQFRRGTLTRVVNEGTEPASELAYAQDELSKYAVGPRYIDTVGGL